MQVTVGFGFRVGRGQEEVDRAGGEEAEPRHPLSRTFACLVVTVTFPSVNAGGDVAANVLIFCVLG